ncbi:MAG: DUF4157 domain-containing protein, partial [Deltaproteobacteria bacterium]|nr:DUF4157 domain-containing protein [Deltaproteobacteria bacterium]
MLPRRPTPPPPRPDLLPAKMRGAAVQPALGTIDTPEFLPGMRPSRVGERRTAMVGRSPHSVFTTPVSSVLLRAMGPGRPLEPRLCAAMEALFETDLSRVTVHEGPTTRTMGALAVTRGDQIHFEAGTYDPTTPEGIQLLGHELAHVVQQRQGRVENPYRRGIAIVQDPVLEAEADRASRAVAKAIVPSHGARTLPWLARHPSRSPSTSAIQRASGRRSMVDLSDVDIHDIPNFDAMGSESHGGGGTFDYFSATGSMGEWARAGAHGLTNLVTGQGRWATVLGLTHGGKSTGRRAVDVGGG